VLLNLEKIKDYNTYRRMILDKKLPLESLTVSAMLEYLKIHPPRRCHESQQHVSCLEVKLLERDSLDRWGGGRAAFLVGSILQVVLRHYYLCSPPALPRRVPTGTTSFR
jgi:hypothetical protein